MSGTDPEPMMPLTRPLFGDEEVHMVRRCLDSGWVTQGPMVRQFEELFQRRHPVQHAISCTSCTAALHLAVLALGIGPGDEVIVPSFTWVTSAHAAEYVGARAVLCDIDPRTFNLDVDALQAAITSRTKAIIAVHLFGLPANMRAVLAAAGGIPVIEDAACAFGTEYQGHPVGGFGAIGCFSFHPRKVITTGEGGMLTTNDDGLARRLRSLRNHGASPAVLPVRPFDMGPFDQLGFNYRLSDIQAAVGVVQMGRFPGLMAERRARAQRYGRLLETVGWIEPPREPEGCLHTYQSYVVWVRPDAPVSRNAIMLHLERQGIQSRPGTLAVHLTGYYRDKYGYRPEQFPVSRRAQEQTITLPIFPGMTDADQDRVVAALQSCRE